MLPIDQLVTSSSGRARAGVLHTDHGDLETPLFMPVGTAGSVKGVSPSQLRDLGAHMILGNTYHLYLRPGTDIIENAGGLHRFISWDGAMLTDSGGYQVFSLAEMNRISDEGVVFQSPHDGSRHELTAERSIEIQRRLGADIIMVFDECTPHPVSLKEARQSLLRTHAWERRSLQAFRNSQDHYGHRQFLFGIVQGSVYPELRRESARAVVDMGFDGYAIGGLSVGESKTEMQEMTEVVTELLPVDQPRYLMGVGKPEDLVAAVDRGVDMFDCVLPTRNARHGVLFTWNGQISLKAGREKDAHIPIDEHCDCYTCRHFSRAYLRHLLHTGELLGMTLATIHNLHFYQDLTREMRKAIHRDAFETFKRDFAARSVSGENRR